MKEISTKKLVETIVEGIRNRKGRNITAIDLRKVTDAPVEYMVIAEGTSSTQVAAVAGEVSTVLRFGGGVGHIQRAVDCRHAHTALTADLGIGVAGEGGFHQEVAHTHADGQGYLIAVYMDQMVQVFCEYGVNASVQETADQKKDLSL